MLFSEEQFPYTDFHDLNLDWILEEVQRISEMEIPSQDEITELQKTLKTLQTSLSTF